MAYNDTHKLRAYTLYLQGISYDKIAEQLRSDFSLPRLSGVTIKNWAETADIKGETWEDQRRKVRHILRQNVENVTASRMAELQAKTQTIQDSLYESLVGGKSPEIKSFEGAVYAFKTIAEFNLMLCEKHSNEVSPLLMAQAMLEIFQEIPEVKRAIKANWKKIQEEIKARLLAEKEVKVLSESTSQ